MNRTLLKSAIFFSALLFNIVSLSAGVVFDSFSAYHHIQVVDDNGLRTLRFNGSQETKMSLRNPLQGHFEYTEYFHTPWVWNTNIQRVLMMGLGGGSSQRAFQHYYTNVMVDTVEVDAMVIDVGKRYFAVVETPTHKIHNNDGRVVLRRASQPYDLIIMDAYATTRYGSSVPAHLTTKEFFALASEHLTTNGVIAYNVIGQVQGWRANFVGALYRTMKEVFPQVYLFPARESMNIVLIGTKSPERFDLARVQREGAALMRSGTVQLPSFTLRLRSFSNLPPPIAARSIVLTDDHAPVENLLRGGEAAQ